MDTEKIEVVAEETAAPAPEKTENAASAPAARPAIAVNNNHPFFSFSRHIIANVPGKNGRVA